ncbi:hypothetical protein LTR85_006338 [Meristemomyces frigidus]|nr:hypothetical protein LTR85_006338 [Meristemomyces frigidus]
MLIFIFLALLGFSCAMPSSLNAIPKEQWVRYCYKDAAAATQLGKYVDLAVQKWLPAIAVSSLNIQLDPRAGGTPSTYCDQLGTPAEPVIDALVISSEPLDSCVTSTTNGYDWSEMDTSYRNTLEFCNYKNNPTQAEEDLWVAMLAHEFGHAVGLLHENQRPDKDHHVKFNCNNLVGWNQAVVATANDVNKFFTPHSSITARMKAVYFPNAVDYIKGDNIAKYQYKPLTEEPRTAPRPQDADWKTYVRSIVFDFESVMLYGSYEASSSPGSLLVLERVGTPDPVFNGGGNADPALKQLSTGDIARVAQMYDMQTPTGDDAKDPDNWGQA